MDLPELPEPQELYLPTHIMRVYPAEQMEEVLRAYALEAVRAERERAARICEELAERGPGNFKHGTPTDCAAAIRAQGSKT